MPKFTITLKSTVYKKSLCAPEIKALFKSCIINNKKNVICFVLAIDEEWQKTQCMPRETYVDVAQELGTSNDMFFKPPCVSVFRCSGCCNKEGVMCRNTSTTYVDKIVLTSFSHFTLLRSLFLTKMFLSPFHFFGKSEPNLQLKLFYSI